jgi:DNA-binding Lrp family transcriptional regulator
MQVDEKDDMIIRQLIRDPRFSDNQISRHTGLPVKTVNRRRKRLEEAGLLSYMTRFNHFALQKEKGASELFIIMMRRGITRKLFRERFKPFNDVAQFAMKHIHQSSIAEKDGQIRLLVRIESWQAEDILEIVNADLFPYLERIFGAGAIERVESYPVAETMNYLHNYIPLENMTPMTIRSEWPDNKIFVR